MLDTFSELVSLGGVQYQIRLESKVKGYGEQLDASYNRLFSLMVDNGIDNIKNGRVSIDDSRVDVEDDGMISSLKALFVAAGLTDYSNGHEPFIEIMKRYDEILHEASDLSTKIGGTFLNTENLQSLLYDHLIMHNGKVDFGKSGAMRMVFHMMQSSPSFVEGYEDMVKTK